MKRLIISIMIVFTTCGVILMPQKAGAADWGIGIYTFYAWWEPSFKGIYENLEYDKNHLYGGPAFSVTFFENWTLGTLFCMELYERKIEYDYKGTGEISGTDYNMHFKSNPNRIDWDNTLTYKINQQFKVFIGYKLNNIVIHKDVDFDEDKPITVSSPYTLNTYFYWERERIMNFGPALGINYTVPLSDNTAIVFSTSGLYTSTKLCILEYYEFSSNVIEARMKEYHYYGIGNNSTITLSYFIEPLSTSISLGGRFQVFKYIAESGSPELSNDYFYGITASAMFIF